MSFGLKGVQESLSQGSEEFLKTCHICYIKLKNTHFSRVREERNSCEKVTKWATKAQKLSREAFSHKPVASQSQ